MKPLILLGALFSALFLCLISALDEPRPTNLADKIIAATVSGSNNYCPPQDGLTKLSQVPERCKHGEYINK